MKNFKFFLTLLIFIIPWTCFSINLDENFENNTMRIDYYHIADAKTEIFTLDQIYKQSIWAGNPDNLIDPFNNGLYLIKVIDLKSKKLLYSRGFNSYCGEYRTTGIAGKGIKKTYHETALIPFPKQKIKFIIESRDKKYRLKKVFSMVIDPESINIMTELESDVEIFQLLKNDNPHKKVDLVVVAEGYSKTDREKVIKNFQQVKEMLFGENTFSIRQKSFNLYGLYAASEDNGVDEPTKRIYKNTVIDSTFNSLGLYRYLLFENNRKLRDITGQVPCDTIIVMVNSNRYGGGGIYNSFSIFTIDNERSKFLLLHEFGHSFAGLADEYYSSKVVYEEFYPPGIEPLEPNITALLPGEFKWKKQLSKNVKIPTPWSKKEYEALGEHYLKERVKIGQEMTQLKSVNDEKKLRQKREELNRMSKKYQKSLKNIFENKKLINTVGAFLGAGYSSNNLYRPMIDCIMFSSRKNRYCKVCEKAIVDMIKYYTGE